MKNVFIYLSVCLITGLLVVSCEEGVQGCIKTAWFADVDGDGLGDPNVSEQACDQPEGYVSNGDDADDTCIGTVDVCGVCNGMGETTWYEDADGNGLGDATVFIIACDQPEGYVANSDEMSGSGLHPAFAAFDTNNYTIYLDEDMVVIESNGWPNHTSPYWSNTTARSASGPMGGTLTTPAAAENHPLFVEPTATSHEMMAPGNIDDFNGAYVLTVPIDPQLASTSTSTGLGPIGMAVSGSMIYNDEEGPNVPLDNAVPSLDYTAAHTGPQSYHYHLEPKAWSDDDDKLIGIIADGFFLYGRKCASTGGYPMDLDESGGHTSPTQHNEDGEYHYHIQNELYLNEYYILFPGDYQGTPNAIR